MEQKLVGIFPCFLIVWNLGEKLLPCTSVVLWDSPLLGYYGWRIVEDDDLINAEDSCGTGNASCKLILLIDYFGAANLSVVLSEDLIR